MVHPQPVVNCGSGQGDVRQETTVDGEPGRHQIGVDWNDSRGSDGTHGSRPSTESMDDDIREAMHDGSGEDDVRLYQHNASIAFDPLVCVFAVRYMDYLNRLNSFIFLMRFSETSVNIEGIDLPLFFFISSNVTITIVHQIHYTYSLSQLVTITLVCFRFLVSVY